jgi:hypothetical protein
MKKLLITLMLISPFSFAEDTDVKISCKILDQIVMALEGGKSTRYVGFADGPKIGGAVSLSLSLTEYSSIEDYQLVIKNSQFPIVHIFETVKKTDLVNITDRYQIIYRNTGIYGNDLTLSLGGSYINLEGDNGSSITGSRYYKNDWNFVVKSVAYGEDQGDGSSFL